MSKVIGYCCGFVLQRSMLGRKHSRHNFSQSDAEQNQWRYFPALGALHVCDSSSHWFIVLFIFVVLGHYNCFGFTTQTVTVFILAGYLLCMLDHHFPVCILFGKHMQSSPRCWRKYAHIYGHQMCYHTHLYLWKSIIYNKQLHEQDRT